MANNITTQIISCLGYFLAALIMLGFWIWKRKMDKFVQEEIERRLEEAKNDNGLPILTFRGRFNDALELNDLCKQLLLFTEHNGYVHNGFRTMEIINQVRTLVAEEE